MCDDDYSGVRNCCKVCQEKYIGETHRTLLTRIKEHHKSSSSQYYDHLIKKHHMAPEMTMTSFKICKVGLAILYREKLPKLY